MESDIVRNNPSEDADYLKDIDAIPVSLVEPNILYNTGLYPKGSLNTKIL